MTDKVLDFNKKREENIEKKRRSFERILFQNFLGAYSVISGDGAVYPVTLVDISRDGCLFQVPWDSKRDTAYKQGDEISMRMYFTKGSYIPVTVTIRHNTEAIGKDGHTYMQYGCEFDKTTPSFEALNNFINFMYSFAEHSSIDKGDQKAFFL